MMKLPTITRYTYLFAFLNFILLLTGVLTLLTVLSWRNLLASPVAANPDIYTRLSITNFVVNGGFVASTSTFITVATSIWVFATRPSRDNAKTGGIRVYLASLFITFLITLTIASIVWFSTLRERNLFTLVWQSLTTNNKIFIQNDLKCCGWFNPTTDGLFSDELRVGFCQDPDLLTPDPDPNVTLGCIDKFDKKADTILNNTFTVSYGFTAVQFFLFIAGSAISKLRIQQKRFMRIDYKLNTGKSAFL